jgi:hypothetical protein
MPLTFARYKVHLIRGDKDRSSTEALLSTVENYFTGGTQGTRRPEGGVQGTMLPPLYFQTPSEYHFRVRHAADQTHGQD